MTKSKRQEQANALATRALMVIDSLADQGKVTLRVEGVSDDQIEPFWVKFNDWRQAMKAMRP